MLVPSGVFTSTSRSTLKFDSALNLFLGPDTIPNLHVRLVFHTHNYYVDTTYMDILKFAYQAGCIYSRVAGVKGHVSILGDFGWSPYLFHAIHPEQEL